VQDTILEGISRGKRRYYHKKVGEVLEKMYSGNIEEVVEDIIYHYDEAGLKDEANKYCKIAGDKFYNIYAYDRAIEYYIRIIDTIKTKEEAKDIIKKLYHAYWNTGKYEDFMPIAEKMLKMFPELAGSIYLYMGELYSDTGKYNTAIEIIKQGFRHTSSSSSIDIQNLKISLAWALAFKGDLPKAHSLVKDAINFFEKELEYTDADKIDIIYGILGNAYNTLGTICREEKKQEKAIEYYEKSIEYVGKKKDTDYRNIAVYHMNIVLPYLEMGDINGSFKHLKLAKSFIYKAPSLLLDAFLDQISGETRMQIGELEEAEGLLKASLKKYRAMKNYFRIVETAVNLSGLYNFKRKFSISLKYLNEVNDMAHKVGDRRKVLDVLFNRFLAHLLSGSFDECKKDIEVLKKEAGDDKRYMHYVLEAEGMLSNETGRYEKATSLYERLLEEEPDNISYLTSLAKGYAGSKDIEKAKELLQRIEKLNENEKIPFQRMINEFYIGEVYYMLGEKDKGISIFKRIYPEFKKRGIHLYTYKIDAYLYSS